jgi:hypothetical protein
MLTEVHVQDEDDESCMITFVGDGESDCRTFWLPGRILLEQVARVCLDARIDCLVKDQGAPLVIKTKKKAA